MMYYDLGNGGNGWAKVSWARQDMGADAYLCCPGPSLISVPRGRGRKIFAVNTAYPKVVPDIWMGLDRVECYNRQLWGEPFIKVCRGNYGNMKVGDKFIRHMDNVFFASVSPVDKDKTLFDYLNHIDPLVWHKNTMATMLHLIIKMGAKTIYLVGCDMGGKDYYDNRQLTPEQRMTNHMLYGEQAKWLKTISILAKERGINIISCTPESPINTFLPYMDIVDALKKSEERVKTEDGPILHSSIAELLYRPK